MNKPLLIASLGLGAGYVSIGLGRAFLDETFASYLTFAYVAWTLLFVVGFVRSGHRFERFGFGVPASWLAIGGLAIAGALVIKLYGWYLEPHG